MLALRSSIRSVVTGALGALSIGACDTLDAPADKADFIAEHAAALQEVPLAPRGQAQWLIDLEIERTSLVEIRIPADVRGPDLDRVLEAKPPVPRRAIRDRFGKKSNPETEVFSGGLELTLFDADTREVLGVALVEDDDTVLEASLRDPCAQRPRCLRQVMLRATWIGVDPVVVRPDIEIAGEGHVHFAR